MIAPGERGNQLIAFEDRPLNFDAWEVIAQSQHPDFDWKLPPGVAVNLQPHQPLLIQTHYLSGSSKKTHKYLTKTELFPVDPKTVTAHAGALFLNDRSMVVPPHSETTATSRCMITSDGDKTRELKIIGINGHYHFRGHQFDAYRVNADGTRGELLYEYKGFDQPAFEQHSDNPIVLHPGEGIEWSCTYQNNTDKTFTYGPDASTQEHCILFGGRSLRAGSRRWTRRAARSTRTAARCGRRGASWPASRSSGRMLATGGSPGRNTEP